VPAAAGRCRSPPHPCGRSPPRPVRSTLRGMCRSIRQLRRADEAGPATTGEAQAAALQYVRKISGFRQPSARNAEAFEAAVDEIATITERLLRAVGTPVAEGPDPFADPVTRRALIADRPPRPESTRQRGRSARAPGASGPAAPEATT
jgi:hypothetical protein